jgi:dephospho-CoA kinase
MLVVGLTGSIGMGKSTVAEHFRAHGIGVFSADAEVHRLHEGAAAPLIEAAFPGSTSEGKVDRDRLTELLLRDPASFEKLEAIVHPLVEAAEREFLRREWSRGARMAVLEIPLLFETGSDARVDVAIVVAAPESVQRQRVLERPRMTPAKLDAILARQMPDAEKRRRAHFVVDTGRPIEQSLAQVDAIIALLQNREGTAYCRFWAGPTAGTYGRGDLNAARDRSRYGDDGP